MKRLRVHGRILLSIVIFIVIISGGTMLLGGQSAGDLSLKEGMLLSSLGLSCSALLVYYWLDRKQSWTLGFTRTGAARHALQGIGLGLLLMTLSFLLIGAFRGYEIQSVNGGTELYIDLLTSCGLFVLVAVGEELFCRGYVQGLLKHHYGVNTSLFVSSILFSLLHLGNSGIFNTPFTLVNIFLIGLFFALARELTGSLWLPIGFHFAWNFSQGNLFGFAVSGANESSVISLTPQGTTLISGGEFGAEGSIVTTILILVVCLISTRRFRSRQQNVEFHA